MLQLCLRKPSGRLRTPLLPSLQLGHYFTAGLEWKGKRLPPTECWLRQSFQLRHAFWYPSSALSPGVAGMGSPCPRSQWQTSAPPFIAGRNRLPAGPVCSGNSCRQGRDCDPRVDPAPPQQWEQPQKCSSTWYIWRASCFTFQISLYEVAEKANARTLHPW